MMQAHDSPDAVQRSFFSGCVQCCSCTKLHECTEYASHMANNRQWLGSISRDHQHLLRSPTACFSTDWCCAG